MENKANSSSPLTLGTTEIQTIPPTVLSRSQLQEALIHLIKVLSLQSSTPEGWGSKYSSQYWEILYPYNSFCPETLWELFLSVGRRRLFQTRTHSMAQLVPFVCEMECLKGQSCTSDVSFHTHRNLWTSEEKVALVEALVWGWGFGFVVFVSVPAFPKKAFLFPLP